MQTSGVRAFTLVELLVVITILVFLLALLAPSLERAIYQADLAVCGSHLHATASAVLVYAVDFRRSFPYRRLVENSAGAWPNQFNNNNVDDRHAVSQYLDLTAALNDPLSADVDLAIYTKDAATRPVWTHASYDLWFGFSFWDDANQRLRGMSRIGDRVQWTVPSSLGTVRYEFDLLASDQDMQTPNGQNFISSHPDDAGLMGNRVLDGQAYDNPATFASSAGTLYAYSWWDLRGVRRGLFDRNFAHADGSVDRITSVDVDDPRFVHVPYTAKGGSNAAWKIQLPHR